MDCNEELKIDLHIHSEASDGTLSPAEILAMAAELGLGAIAITDHDTISGSREAVETGLPPSVDFLTGIEISAAPPESYPCKGSFHILGYSIRLDDPVLNRTIEILQDSRNNRNPRIIKRLNDLGFDISVGELVELYGESQLGRPHIARLMIRKGIVGSINEAFDRYLGRGKPAYADKYRIECARAIEVIRAAGGIPVLAHPGLVEPVGSEPFEKLVRTLRDMGLRGIEVYYPEHTPADVRMYVEIAERYGMLLTGGTDFHGAVKPDVKMGSGKGGLNVPYSLYQNLVRHSEQHKQATPENHSASKMQMKLKELEKKLDYEFRDTALLEQACRHSSFVNEQPESGMEDNERLEFLGDAVLNLVIGDLLMKRNPDLNEGNLSRMRASLVNELQLSKIARSIGLGNYIELGKGEIQTKGREKKSILADTMEAVIAAVYLDGGFGSAFDFILKHFETRIAKIEKPSSSYDYKSQFQEIVQVTLKVTPEYRVIGETGPDHDKTFHVRIKAAHIEAEGVGKSKKLAEQDAAKKAIEMLDKD